MSAYFNSTKGRWLFEFDKVINNQRVRATKTLPKGWNRAKADAFDKAETDRLYQIATGGAKSRDLIEDAVAQYITHHCPGLDDGDGITKELARIHWAYEGKYIDELAEVGRIYSEKMREADKPLKPATIRNRLSYLRAACRYAQKFHGMGGKELLTIAVPKPNNARHEYANRAEMLEIARLAENRYVRALIRMGFYSGMRIGEMMTIGHISNIADGRVLLRKTKNDDPRAIPIHPKALVLCQFFPIPYKKRWMQKLWERARDEAGFEHLHFHDLRHSTASSMVNAGVDLFTIGAVLGHRDQRSTQRYSHLATSTLDAAIRKIR